MDSSASVRPHLTTVFTPLPTCFQTTDIGTAYSGQYYHEYDPAATGPGLWEGSWTSCYPPQFSDVWSQTPVSPGYYYPGYYSPGICPSGYTIGSDIISQYGSFYSLSAYSQTGGRCCLSGWSPASYEEYCVQTISSTIVSAPGINIRWMATDLSLYGSNSPGMPTMPTSTPSTAVSSSQAIATMTSLPSSKPSSTASSNTTSAILSTGAKVAIGVVIPLFFLAVVLVGLYIFRKRRFGRRTSTNLGSTGVTELDSRPKDSAAMELDSSLKYPQQNQHLLYDERVELQGQEKSVAELDTTR